MRLVVALDLEGTLISNAISTFPRPGASLRPPPLLASCARLWLRTDLRLNEQ